MNANAPMLTQADYLNKRVTWNGSSPFEATVERIDESSSEHVHIVRDSNGRRFHVALTQISLIKPSLEDGLRAMIARLENEAQKDEGVPALALLAAGFREVAAEIEELLTKHGQG